MSRIIVIIPSTATGDVKTLLDAVQAKLGVTPNFLHVQANAPIVLESFPGLHGIAGNGKLDLQTRERITIALAQQNNCDYCLSVHSFIGRRAGLTGDEIAAQR